jgi:hypothetical protein
MESKIVLGVMITLVIVFFGINNSGLNESQSSGSPSIGNFVSSILGSFGQSPEPDNNFTISVQLNSSAEIPVKAERLEVEGLRELNEIDSETDIGLKGFDGVIELNETNRISGTASGYYLEQLDSNSSQEIDVETDTDLIEAFNTERRNYNLDVESGSIFMGNEDISISNSTLEVTSFEGNISISPQRRLDFEGRAAYAESGSVSVGTE